MKINKSLFWSTSLAFAFWGVIATIGPLAASDNIISNVSSFWTEVFLLAGPLTVPLGNFVMGIFSDRYGRKNIFFLTMTLYSIGIIMITFSSTVYLLLAGLIMSQFGVGGEEPSSLSLIAEDSNATDRPFYLTIITNMNNISSAVVAAIFIFPVSTEIQRLMLLTISVSIIVTLAIARLSLPESYRWYKAKGNEKKAQEEKNVLNITDEGIRTNNKPSILPSIILLGMMGISQYITFGLLAYNIGPIEFPKISSILIFVALTGSSVAGFIAAFLVKGPRKSYTLYSYLSGLITILIIMLILPYISNLYIFLPLLFANMFCSEFAWASRVVLEPELFSTGVRSTMIGVVRLFPMIVYVITIVISLNLSVEGFIIENVILWALGVFAAILYFIVLPETKGIDISYTD